MSETLSDQASSGTQVGAGPAMATNPPSSLLQDLNIAITAVAPILAMVAVSLRIFVRAQLRTMGWGECNHE